MTLTLYFCVMQLEQEINRQRVARKWYLIVIVLLYVGLLASFSLNVSLLLRKPQTRLINNEKFPGKEGLNNFAVHEKTVIAKVALAGERQVRQYTEPQPRSVLIWSRNRVGASSRGEDLIS